MKKTADIAIIGAGIVGCCIARQLGIFGKKVVVFEKENALGKYASGNNSSVIHSGFNPEPGTLKAKTCVRGNALMYPLCQSLGVSAVRCGTLVVAQNDSDIKALEWLQRKAFDNKVPGTAILFPDQIRRIEPFIQCHAAFHSPSGGVTDSRKLLLAVAQDAEKKGAVLKFNQEIHKAESKSGRWHLKSQNQQYSADVVINCAGIFADRVAQFAQTGPYPIYPCRGQYYAVDRCQGHLLSSMAYPIPEKHGPGLGMHLTKMIDGSILVGPNAQYVSAVGSMENLASKEEFVKSAKKLLPELQAPYFYPGTVGYRAKLSGPDDTMDKDFVIKEDAGQWINLVGIESPGLTAAPALAETVVAMLDFENKAMQHG